MLDLPALMVALSRERPVFHSEADFQHALAWAIHARYDASIRLELPLLLEDKQGHLDLLATTGNTRYAIEQKYKTSAFKERVGEEEFHLKNQAAQDINRYDILKDLSRLEQVSNRWNDTIGWLVFLTNDSSYWQPTRKPDAVDAAFRIHEGLGLSGTLDWGATTGEGTKKGRKSPITLKGRYLCEWRGYSEVSGEKNTCFRYLLIRAKG